MPNVKIYVDEAIYAGCRDRLSGALRPIRDMLCEDLTVDAPACQFAVIPVLAMPDLPPVNVEIAIMPRPERTRQVLLAVCAKLRELVGAATGAHVAIRVTTLDPETYIALK
ncbi:hypothetical protein [Tabrizicola sp. BL-A-41-H6]|uniref:hypothetical protein n=1 Tax=Tabrizicola sp. BL-A-41-H6 TaxID=3421107 RepID=UPI003D66C61D